MIKIAQSHQAKSAELIFMGYKSVLGALTEMQGARSHTYGIV